MLIPAKNGCQLGDGGLGALLYSWGLSQSQTPERWLLEQPDRIQAAHAAFRDAGAQWLLTTTFGATAPRLAIAGLAGNVVEINHLAVRCARAVAGAMPVIGSIGPTASSDPGVWTSAYSEQAWALVDAGVDGALVETIVRLDEGLAGIRAAIENGATSVWASFTPGVDGRMLDGTAPEAAAAAFVNAGATVIGANCGSGPESLIEPVQRLLATQLAPVLAMPSAGLPTGEPPNARYPVQPGDFAEAAIQFSNMGVRYFAGCCGIGPEHLRAAADRMAKSVTTSPGE